MTKVCISQLIQNQDIMHCIDCVVYAMMLGAEARGTIQDAQVKDIKDRYT